MFPCNHSLRRDCFRRLSHNVGRCYATPSGTPQSPPLLQKLRNDLKTAMRAKDTNRLDVVRGLLSEVTNASRPPNKPMNTDIQILSILRKRLAASRQAAEQFASGGRHELKEKEDAQIGMMEGYAGTVETISEDEIRTRVGEGVNEMSEDQKTNKGAVVKRLLGPGGIFEGKPVERKNVVNMVDVALGPPKG